MGAPQIIMIVLISVGVSRSMIKHGEPDGTVSFPATAIGPAITVWLLIWGGFFSGGH